jgi:arylsulfatase A-like enzyme
LRPIVETPEYDGREFVVVDHGLYTAQRAIRTEQWKLIRTYHSGMWERVTPEFQLYNMNTDPMEQTNLANKRPDTVNTLRGKLLEWVDRHRNISEDALLRVAKDGPAGYNAFVDEFGQA